MAKTHRQLHHPDAWPYYFTADLFEPGDPVPRQLVRCTVFVTLPSLQWRRAGARHLPGPADAFSDLAFRPGAGGATLWSPADCMLSCFLAVQLRAKAMDRGALFRRRPAVDAGRASAAHWAARCPHAFSMFVSLTAADHRRALGSPARNAVGRGLPLALSAASRYCQSRHPWRPLPHSAFFAPGRVEAVLGPDPRILILPFAINGPSSYWQMENNYRFHPDGRLSGLSTSAHAKIQGGGGNVWQRRAAGFCAANSCVFARPRVRNMWLSARAQTQSWSKQFPHLTGLRKKSTT